MTTSTDPRCLHCDAALGARELSEGWCDSCGKRLPTGGRPKPQAIPAVESPAATGAGRSRFVVWGGVALGLLFAAAAIAAAAS